MKIKIKSYLIYKFFNSLFLGLSVGTVFIIYEPLKPSIYSIGGILLALGTLVLASQYKKLINKEAFFIILLIVELITFIIILTFLIFKESLFSALVIYICYQITFLFGNYIIRVETFLLKRTKLLSIADILKQIGYLAGLGLAFLCYKIFEFQNILDKVEQVYYLHYMLCIVQFVIIFYILASFKIKRQ